MNIAESDSLSWHSHLRLLGDDIFNISFTLIRWGLWGVSTLINSVILFCFILGLFLAIGLATACWERLTQQQQPRPVPQPLLVRQRERSPARDAPIPATREEDECFVCKTNERNYLAVPCGHQSVCSECKDNIENNRCPVCRARIKRWQRVYR
jgi:hypothetical protein